ncbi:MAG: HD domain-containing protein [Pseudomonadota bacterium]
MEDLYRFMTELDKLKSVYRKVYLIDESRKENSAEHSWHLAMAVLTTHEKFNLEFDALHAVKLALVHDVCEIDAGDLSVFDANRQNKHADEKKCIARLAAFDEPFAAQLMPLWEEYEAQKSEEARWVKVMDRLLPFMTNYATEGRAWQEMGIRADQVREVMAFIETRSPEIYNWLMEHVDRATDQGWLRENNKES